MNTVTRGRVRKPVVDPGLPSPLPGSSFSEDGFMGWAQRKADHEIRKQTFAYELEQGIINQTETRMYTSIDISLIENMVRHYQSEYELNKDIPGFTTSVEAAIQSNDLEFDFDMWDPSFRAKLQNFQDYEVVFFRNRTTAFTLPKPCPNCGQKKLIAEGSVFTRAADEAASQFATCKNCSSRFRLQSVL